jgi:hypothetical protein
MHEPSDYEDQTSGYLNADRFIKRSRILFTRDGPVPILPAQGAQRHAKTYIQHSKSDNDYPPIAAIYVSSLRAAADMVRLAISLPAWILAIFSRWL